MRRALLTLGIVTAAAAPLGGQQVTIGGGYALADYQEQAAFLHFRGAGPTATLAIERGRLALRVDASHLDLDPADDTAAPLEPFSIDQIGIRLGVRTMSFVGLEAGYFRRSTAPSRAAQSYSAATIGVRAAYPLAPGADVALRTAYVAGTDFSGGGSAPFGIELGLGAAYGPGSGRFRLTGDYEFQRIDRHTDQNGTRLNVPIQSSVARFGVSVRF
ncbi:MAG: outer membrane protein [Gemmatimonadales bacterium]